MDETSQVIRRKDIAELGDKFASSMAPMGQVLEEMKLQNITSKQTNRQVKMLAVWLTTLTVAFTAGIILEYYNNRVTRQTSALQRQAVADGHRLKTEISGIAQEIQSLIATAKDIDEGVEEVRAGKESAPKVELVAETDPVKARTAPVKVRITPPKKSKEPEPAAQAAPKPTPAPRPPVTVELPIRRGAL